MSEYDITKTNIVFLQDGENVQAVAVLALISQLIEFKHFTEHINAFTNSTASFFSAYD